MRPLRRTIRHLAQRLRMDGETFMYSLLTYFRTPKFFIIQAVTNSVQYLASFLDMSWDSQDEGLTFGDGYRVFKMCRQ
jgi:hypothetical protein